MLWRRHELCYIGNYKKVEIRELHYNANLKQDKQLIYAKYNTLELTVRNEINSYCTESALQSIEDLK